MKSGEKNVVIADANVLLSAICGKAASKVFSIEVIRVITTAYTISEVCEYIPRFAEQYSIQLDELFNAIADLDVDIRDWNNYQEHIQEANELIIDPDDVELGALALKEKAPVWSNDNHFKGFPTGRFTTAELLKSFGI